LPCLQEGLDTLNGRGSRVTAFAQVEDEPGIANGLSAKTGWSYVTPAKKFFHFSQQMHLSFLIVWCDSATRSIPMQFLLV
jgi:hypothetical protein